MVQHFWINVGAQCGNLKKLTIERSNTEVLRVHFSITLYGYFN